LSLYNAAVKPNDYNARLSEFVSQLFNALAQMVQSKVIQDADTLGITLGAIFDWCISLLYAEKTANTGWLYCPNAQMGFYPYIKSCPHCGRVEQTEISVNTVARPRSLDAYYETIVLLQKGTGD